MRRERVRNFSGTCPWVPPGAGRLLSPPSGVRRGRSPRRRGRLGWAVGALLLALAAPVVAQTTAPPVITSAPTFTVDENTTAVATLTATDADADSLEWSIPTDGGADAEQFTLTSAGVLTFSTAPDYEAPADADEDNVYEVTVQVSDGTTPVPADLEVTVENVIELTTFSGPTHVTFAENAATRVATFSYSSDEDRDGIQWLTGGVDRGLFSLDSPSGALRFLQAPDFENPLDVGPPGRGTNNSYELKLVAWARDNGPIFTDEVDVKVTVTDVDEAGALSLSSTRPALGAVLTAVLSDPDGVTAGTAVWQWERSTGRNAWAVIADAATASYTPVAADTNTFLRVTATYADEHGTGKTVSEVAPNVVLGPLLTGLTAETENSRANPDRLLEPSFEADTLHYRIGCAASDTLTLVATGDATARISVNGMQVASGSSASVAVARVGEVPVTVTDDSGAETTYHVHCFPTNFPLITASKTPGASGVLEDLLLLSPDSYFLVMDSNGVPRYLDLLPERAGTYIRFQRVGPSGQYRYSYSGGGQQVIRNENFEVIRMVSIVAPLTRTGAHDQRLLENGNSLLMTYEPSTRDLSHLTFTDKNGDPWGAAVSMTDSATQIVTPDGKAEFTWNSWGRMPLEDCSQHRFPDDYAHINSVQVVDDLIIVSLRGCGKILALDPDLSDSHKIAWRLGQTNLSDEEWGARNLGPAPLDIIGDPEGAFCGQHAAQILPNNHLVLFDNGAVCVVNPWTGDVVRRQSNGYSRALEYALDLENDEAVFLRDHSLHGERMRFGGAGGHVEPLGNGDWLISWGRELMTVDPPALSEVVTQVDPATGQEKFSLVMPFLQQRERATVMPAEALAPQSTALEAQMPASSHTSVFHTGAADAPQVAVAFSRPVVDFDETSPSLSVIGATVASVSPHVVAGERAHAYRVTLTPTDDGPITFGLVADQACADGGICTADGTLLSDVPSVAHAIPGPVTVSFGATNDVTEGGTTSVIVELNRAHGRAGGVEIPLVVGSGSTAGVLDYTVPAAVTFAAAETTKSVVLQADADASIEEAETVAVAFGTLPDGVTAGTPTTTTVTITDGTPSAVFTLTLNPSTVVEGNTADVIVAITNGVTFATAQPLTLSFSGTATQGSDYTVDSPTLRLLAEQQSSAPTTLRVLDDVDTENAETISVAAHHGTTRIIAQTATIPASDRPAITPHISVYPWRSSVGEAEGASFTVTRTGTTARLTVAVRVTESGSLLAGPPPTTVTFAVGQENAPLPLPTVDDRLVEGASETSVVTVTVQADTMNDPSLYLLGSPATAQVTVEDDDEAAFAVTVTPNPVTEGADATVSVAITNPVTFPADQTLTLVFSGTATQGTDYTVGAPTLTLLAGETSVPTVLTVLDDKAEEPAETLGITAQHDGQTVGQATLTIAASADTAPPTLEQAEVPRAGRSLRLTFSEPLDEANAPPRTAFVVTVDDNGTVTSMAVTSVRVSGETVTLSLAAPVLPGQVVTVDYTVPSSAWPALRDPAGNEVVSFADAAVDNQAGRPVVTRPLSGGGGGGGGGGGSACTDDLHGNSAAQASAIALATVTPGAICPVADVDYVTVTAPGRGLLFVDTTGSGQLRGTLWQDGTVLASGATDGSGQAARLGARVQTGPVVVAIQGQGGATGAYEVIVTFTPGYLENPGPDSFQSGIGVLSGWVCDADQVELVLGNGAPQIAAYGTERLDTTGVCGDTDNGFGLLFNWNLLGEGVHDVIALVDGVELDRAAVTVTTLGAEFVRGAAGECTAADFPLPGERVALVWQQNSQNFVLARGSPPTRTGPGQPTLLTGFLENPGPHSFQSGIGILSGWVCDADQVELVLGDLTPQIAAYGTERLDTAGVCGDTDNGFGLLFNWNLLGDGEHAVVAYVDDEELGRATVRVTMLGEEFLRGAEGECVVPDFPMPGETVTLAWQQNQQNFVITAVE